METKFADLLAKWDKTMALVHHIQAKKKEIRTINARQDQQQIGKKMPQNTKA